MEDIIEMSKDKFLKILHRDDISKYEKALRDQALRDHQSGNMKLACATLEGLNKSLTSGPFRIGDIEGDIGYLICYENANVGSDQIKQHIQIYIQKVKLI